MGVVYKLKTEVVDFIVNEKRNNPTMGCRKLADTVKEKFQVDVSKSSVNAIIKQSSLSSPVGRRPNPESQKKGFKIPQERKAELFVEKPPVLEAQSPEEKPASTAQEPPPTIRPQIKEAPIVKGRPFGSPLARGMEPRASTASVPTGKPVAPDAVEPLAQAAPPPIPPTPPVLPTAEKKDSEKPLPLMPDPLVLLKAEVTEETKENVKETPPQPAPPVEKEEKPEKEMPSLKRSDRDDKVWTPDVESLEAKGAPRVSQERGIFYDGMGCFFLKAAEWELSNSSILGGLLVKHLPAYPAVDITAMSEALLYLEAFGIKKLENIESDENLGLWELNDIKQKLSYETLVKAVKGIYSLKSLSLGLINEYTQLFTEISYIKLTFADKTEVCIDGRFQSIWLENNILPVATIPLNKVLSYLSSSIIHNAQPLIIGSIPGYKSFAKQFFDLMLAFQDSLDKRIVKIGIFDSRKDEIARFTAIPAKKRSFIIGAWPWQEECKKFIEEDIRLIKSFFLEALQKEIYYSELKTKIASPTIGQNIAVRVGLLRESGLGWPVVGVVTNLKEEAMSIEDVISSYVLCWPNLKEGHDDFVARTEKATYGAIAPVLPIDKVPLWEGGDLSGLFPGATELFLNIRFLLSSLNNYCQRHFFPPHYEKLDFPLIKERFYGLPGYVKKSQNVLSVSLLLPEGYGHHKDLEYTIKRLNESDVKDYSGARLIMGIQT